ncbi:MAG: PTS sugar transporter subunit IIB [Defluviitaleaceae bacterium]|nr:PTS sugar transporter subunit IIB [Defluviitaleaceae bacterium]
MTRLKIIAVCGFGVGSSLLLKMKVDEMLKKNGMTHNVETCDVGSATSIACDIIFTSNELAGKISERASVPVIAIGNFLDLDEIQDKGLDIIKNLMS